MLCAWRCHFGVKTGFQLIHSLGHEHKLTLTASVRLVGVAVTYSLFLRSTRDSAVTFQSKLGKCSSTLWFFDVIQGPLILKKRELLSLVLCV